MEIIGHRGNGAGTEENTLASCRQALAAGADRLELDVQLVGGQLVLAHPPRAARDTLQNILNHLDVPLILHLKRRHYNPRHDRRAIEQLAPLIRGRKSRDITLSSFWPGTLIYLKQHHPEIRTAFGTMWAFYDLFMANRLGVAEYHSRHYILNRRMVPRAHAKNIQMIVFTRRNDAGMIKKLRDLRVDGVMTDRVTYWRAATEK